MKNELKEKIYLNCKLFMIIFTPFYSKKKLYYSTNKTKKSVFQPIESFL